MYAPTYHIRLCSDSFLIPHAYTYPYKIQAGVAMAGQDEGDLFDEVWKLTSKFYLDRSFGGNDWERVRIYIWWRVSLSPPIINTNTQTPLLISFRRGRTSARG